MSVKSRTEIESVITKRLQSSWGRPISSVSASSALTPFSPASRGTTSLHDMLLSEGGSTPDWDVLLSYVQRFPREVMRLDRRGRTALASACALRPPARVVRELIRACRFGTEASCDKSGNTALHIAILANGDAPDVEVIRELCYSPKLVEMADFRGGRTPMHLACMMQMEEVVSIFLKCCPKSANQIDFRGRTPLYVALEFKASHAILELLVQANPEAVSLTSTVSGRTALITALHNNSEYKTLCLIVNVRPDVVHLRDDRERSPLQCALSEGYNDPDILALLIPSKDVVLEYDEYGRNALHTVLSRFSVDANVVRVLLGAAPEASRVPTKCGEHPLAIAYTYYSRAVQELRHRPNSLTANRTMQNWWKVVEIILNAATSATCMLHAALQTSAPIEVVDSILKESPEEIKIRNEHGDFPIAVAMKGNSESNKDSLLNLLLDQDDVSVPSTASALDHENRSLLSIATATTTGSYNPISLSTVRRLINKNPVALSLIDPKTEMYPLMIAACNATTTDINVIYLLLSAAPQLLQLTSPHRPAS